MTWVSDLIEHIIRKYFGYTDLVFAWCEEESVDPLVQSQILEKYVGAGIMDVNEARAVLGLAAKTPDELASEMKVRTDAMKPAAPTAFGGDGNGNEGSSNPKPTGDEKATPAQKISKVLMDNGGLHVHVASPDVIVDFCPVVHLAK